jgi:hypothetical protein
MKAVYFKLTPEQQIEAGFFDDQLDALHADPKWKLAWYNSRLKTEMYQHLIITESIETGWFFNRVNNYVSESVGPFGTKEAARQADRILMFTGWTRPLKRRLQWLRSERKRNPPGDGWGRPRIGSKGQWMS